MASTSRPSVGGAALRRDMRCSVCTGRCEAEALCSNKESHYPTDLQHVHRQCVDDEARARVLRHLNHDVLARALARAKSVFDTQEDTQEHGTVLQSDGARRLRSALSGCNEKLLVKMESQLHAAQPANPVRACDQQCCGSLTLCTCTSAL